MKRKCPVCGIAVKTARTKRHRHGIRPKDDPTGGCQHCNPMPPDAFLDKDGVPVGTGDTVRGTYPNEFRMSGGKRVPFMGVVAKLERCPRFKPFFVRFEDGTTSWMNNFWTKKVQSACSALQSFLDKHGMGQE